MSTPMDIDPPAAAPPAEHSHADESKGKGKEEKPRFEVKKVNLII
jgi:RING-box protein 1